MNPADHDMTEPFTRKCRNPHCGEIYPIDAEHMCRPREREQGWNDERPHPLVRVTVYVVLGIIGMASTGYLLSYAASLL